MHKRGHKYLNQIGISSKEPCIFNTSEFDMGKMRKYRKERRKYGFDGRETWCLSYTLISWIYSHIRYMQEEAGKIIDWKYHKFNIPVLIDVYGPYTPNGKYRYHKVSIEEHNANEIWDIISEYCVVYLKSDIGFDLCAEEKAMCVVEIISYIFPILWW